MANSAELHAWLDEYSDSHQNPTNILIHKICVPTIAMTVLAFLWSFTSFGFIKKPLGGIIPNVIRMAALGPILSFYFRLSTEMAVTMLTIIAVAFLFLWTMEKNHWPIFRLALTIFVLAWIGQFIGHGIEGKKPSFIDDLKFLAVGPLWTLASAFRALGIQY